MIDLQRKEEGNDGPRTPMIPAGASAVVIIFTIGGLLHGTTAVTAQFTTPGAGPTPVPIEVILQDVAGMEVGVTVFVESGDGLVTIPGGLSGLTPGEHGIHVHETGVCDANDGEPFSSAGAHHNPAGVKHGAPAMVEAIGTPAIDDASPSPTTGHAGDLGTIVVDTNGFAVFELSTDRFDLKELADVDGSALVIHEQADDLVTDPSGDRGVRLACGVIAASEPAGTPSPATAST